MRTFDVVAFGLGYLTLYDDVGDWRGAVPEWVHHDNRQTDVPLGTGTVPSRAASFPHFVPATRTVAAGLKDCLTRRAA
jgi:hypothetical protein